MKPLLGQSMTICPVSEFNEFKQILKCHKNWFQLSAGFNLELIEYNFKYNHQI